MATGRGIAGGAGDLRKAREVSHCPSRRPARRGSMATTTRSRDHHLATTTGWDLLVARGSALVPRVSLWSPSDHGKGGHDQEDKQQDGKRAAWSVGTWAIEGGKSAVRFLGRGAKATTTMALGAVLSAGEETARETVEPEVAPEAPASGAEAVGKGATTTTTVNVRTFLRDVSQDKAKLRTFRYMSSMSEQAYYTGTLTNEGVRRRYGLRLVATSEDFKASLRLGTGSSWEVFEQGDGMCVSSAWEEERRSLARTEMEEEVDFEAIYASTFGDAEGAEGAGEDAEGARRDMSDLKKSADLLAREEGAESEEAESTSAGSGGLGAVGLALETAKGLTAFVSGYTRSFNLGATQEALARELADKMGSSGAPSGRQDNDPCEWLVCDDPDPRAESHPTRYIALQGSDSVDHWVTNLSFDPVDFEQGDLKVKIHAGIYKAAEKLERQLIPAIEEHIAEHGKRARFVFTGHSLGGAIASCLCMMLVHRGIMGPEMLEGVYTYGCPAFICHQDEGQEGEGEGEPILRKLGLRASVFNHLCMHRDIVPRAFACDWGLVRGVFTKMDTFREHPLLVKEGVPSMYEHVGSVYFLQPSTHYLQFARPEGDSPLLPPGQGCWRIEEPTGRLKVAMMTANTAASLLGVRKSPYANDVSHAIEEIFNNPHPIETLKMAQAYGHEGGVSRYHKPKNYTRALGYIISDMD